MELYRLMYIIRILYLYKKFIGVFLNEKFFLLYIIMYNLREISEMICCR